LNSISTPVPVAANIASTTLPASTPAVAIESSSSSSLSSNNTSSFLDQACLEFIPRLVEQQEFMLQTILTMQKTINHLTTQINTLTANSATNTLTAINSLTTNSAVSSKPSTTSPRLASSPTTKLSSSSVKPPLLLPQPPAKEKPITLLHRTTASTSNFSNVSPVNYSAVNAFSRLFSVDHIREINQQIRRKHAIPFQKSSHPL
jgi:hypothetical protein